MFSFVHRKAILPYPFANSRGDGHFYGGSIRGGFDSCLTLFRNRISSILLCSGLAITVESSKPMIEDKMGLNACLSNISYVQ